MFASITPPQWWSQLCDTQSVVEQRNMLELAREAAEQKTGIRRPLQQSEVSSTVPATVHGSAGLGATSAY